MPILLYFIGVFVGVAGLLAIGFAIPFRDFGLGNTLIGAGATAVVGGLVLIGLGVVAREVRRLAKAFERPVQRPVDAAAARAAGRAPLPTPAPPVPARGRSEPRLDVPAGAEAGAQRQRPDVFAAIRGAMKEPPVVEAETAPLSPTLPPRVVARAEAAETPAAAPRLPEPGHRPVSPAALASRAAARLDVPRGAPEQPRHPPEPRPASERAERPSRNLFDTVWPTEPRRPAEPSGEPAPAERPAGERLFREPIVAEEHVTPERPAPAPETTDQEPGADELRTTREPPAAREPRPVAILKSGVIDGMAYTLYTDGSIEAQLPKGLMRFASIEELRSYLERNGGA